MSHDKSYSFRQAGVIHIFVIVGVLVVAGVFAWFVFFSKQEGQNQQRRFGDDRNRGRIGNFELANTKPVVAPSASFNFEKSFMFLTVGRDFSNPDLVRRAREFGANSITVGFDLHNVGSEITFPERESQLDLARDLIREAHKNGLHTEIRTTTNPESDNIDNLDQAIESVLPIMEDLAKFAEVEGVARFALYGETENQLAPEEGIERLAGSAMTRFNQETLRVVQKHFNGQIGAGFCCELDELPDKGVDITGFDYLVISMNPGGDTPRAEFFSNLNSHTRLIKSWASQNGIDDVIIGEVGFVAKEDDFEHGLEEQSAGFTYVVSETEEVRLYEEIFSRTSETIDGYSFYYGFPILSVLGRDAEDVISDWYSRL